MIRTLHADAVLLGDGTTIRDGAVVLDGNVVRQVGPASGPGERVRGVLMPGLINAHTHLELSGMRGKTPPGGGFVPWLTALQKARVEEMEEERDAAIDAAIAAMHEAGVVAVGEVTNSLAAVGRLSRRFLGTIWHEVFGLSANTKIPNEPPSTPLKYVPTPHSLYSTHPDVVRALMRQVGDAPMTIHLAEHAAERAFLRDGGGPLAAFYTSRGLTAFEAPRLDPIAYARALGLLRPNMAVVHLADARPEELDGLAESGVTAILCPRSNLMIETRLPPLLALRSRGVPIAMGTDSLASSPSLDPLAEARALLDRTPEVPASYLIAAATSGGARAIGWPSLGRLVAGTAPGVLHIDGALPHDVDPSAWVLKNLNVPRRLIAPAGAAS
jgi:aminodeoxyfutalosine deaminase